MRTNFYRSTAPRKARRPLTWLSDPTPLRAPYVVPLLGASGAWATGERRYWAGYPLRLLPRDAARRRRA